MTITWDTQTEDWAKRTWDVRVGIKLVTTLTQLFRFLGVQNAKRTEQLSALAAFCQLPAWGGAPRSLKTQARRFLETSSAGTRADWGHDLYDDAKAAAKEAAREYWTHEEGEKGKVKWSKDWGEGAKKALTVKLHSTGRPIDSPGQPIPHAPVKRLGPYMHPPGDWHNAKGNDSYGAVVFDNTGRVLLRAARGKFGGALFTFPKGGAEFGESPQQAALREVLEETGHRPTLVDHLPKAYQGTTGQTRYFLAHNSADSPPFDRMTAEENGETSALTWAYPHQAWQLLATSSHPVRYRDQQVLKDATERWAAIHPNSGMLPLPEPQPPPAPKWEPKPNVSHEWKSLFSSKHKPEGKSSKPSAKPVPKLGKSSLKAPPVFGKWTTKAAPKKKSVLDTLKALGFNKDAPHMRADPVYVRQEAPTRADWGRDLHPGIGDVVGWIPHPKWLEGEAKWKAKGEAEWKAHEWTRRGAKAALGRKGWGTDTNDIADAFTSAAKNAYESAHNSGMSSSDLRNKAAWWAQQAEQAHSSRNHTDAASKLGAARGLRLAAQERHVAELGPSKPESPSVSKWFPEHNDDFVLQKAEIDADALPRGEAHLDKSPMDDLAYEQHRRHVEYELTRHGAGYLLTSPHSTHISEDRVGGVEGAYTPERLAQQEAVLQHFQSQWDGVPSERRAVFLSGIGGSGKSSGITSGAKSPDSIASKLGLKFARYDDEGNGVGSPTNFVTINPDDIKTEMAKRGMIPDIDALTPMEASVFSHEEASYLATVLAARSEAAGKNTLFDITMNSVKSGDKRLASLDANGYHHKTGVFFDVSPGQSIRSTAARHRNGHEAYLAGDGEGGRYVPSDLVVGAATPEGIYKTKNRAAFETLRSRGAFDHSIVVTNEGFQHKITTERGLPATAAENELAQNQALAAIRDRVHASAEKHNAARMGLPVLPWVNPPAPRGKVGRKAGGFSAVGVTNTALGDQMEEGLQRHLHMINEHPNRRQGPLDLRYGNQGFEVKAQSIAAEEYKAKPKAREILEKKTYATEHGLVPNTMISVYHPGERRAYIYSKEGIGAYRLTNEKNGWRFHGTIPLDLGDSWDPVDENPDLVKQHEEAAGADWAKAGQEARDKAFQQYIQVQHGINPSGNVVKTGDPKEALQALMRGDYVQLSQPRQVSTLVKELAKAVKQAALKGDELPQVTLCKVSVKGSDLFCLDAPGGILRSQMPQLHGVPTPGSPADRLTKDDKGKVDIGPMFLDYLRQQGATIETTDEGASYLHASQSQIDGVKAAGMAERIGKQISQGTHNPRRVVVSSDNYIVDGHHHWAGAIAHGLGTKSDISLPVARVNMDILPLLAEAYAFATQWGLQPKSVTDRGAWDELLYRAATGIPSTIPGVIGAYGRGTISRGEMVGRLAQFKYRHNPDYEPFRGQPSSYLDAETITRLHHPGTFGQVALEHAQGRLTDDSWRELHEALASAADGNRGASGWKLEWRADWGRDLLHGAEDAVHHHAEGEAWGKAWGKGAQSAASGRASIAKPVKDFTAWGTRYDEWSKGLSPGDISTFRNYTGTKFSARANSGLRKGGLSGEDREKADKLDNLIKSAPVLTEPVVTYRGLARVPKTWKGGMTIRDPGFMSTTLDAATATRNFGHGTAMMEIKVPSGAHAAFMSSALSPKYNNERELLFPRGTAIRLSSVRVSQGNPARGIPPRLIVHGEVVS